MDQINQLLTQQTKQLDRLTGTALAVAIIVYIGWLSIWASFAYAAHRLVTVLDDKWKAERIEQALRTDAERLNAPFKASK